MSTSPVKVTTNNTDEDFTASSTSAAPLGQRIIISKEDLKSLEKRSNLKGGLRLTGHLLVIFCSGCLYGWLILKTPTGSWWSSWAIAIIPMILLGFSFATMFACMHECLHHTAFQNVVLNDCVAWFAGLLSFYNSTFFRYSHGWHHGFTQVPGKDPELEDPKPITIGGYFIEISGLMWWNSRLREHINLVLGDVSDYPFIHPKARHKVIRSGRMQLFVYMLLIMGSTLLIVYKLVALPIFIFFWLLPLIIGQPFLRMILLADHTACSLDSNALSNTRTTYTLPFIRFLMWEMPFHAEHHRYPKIPFHSLAKAHRHLKPHLKYVMTDGFLGAQRQIISKFPRIKK